MAMADVIVFGASGFAGRRVLREFLRVASSQELRLLIAGRSRANLEAALEWAKQSISSDLHSTPPMIVEADVNDPASLASMCSKARLVCSCVGPFRLYGEPVVAACIEAGIDYLDVTGEPEFMERMEAKYHEKAVERGSLVVSACGYDSVPAELGVMFNSMQWQAPSQPNTVDAYLTLHSSKRIRGNFATYESAVLGVGSVQELQKLRKSLPKRSKFQVPGTPAKRSPVHWEDKLGSWAMKLPSADAIVVRRTLTTIAENPDGLVPSLSDEDRKRWTQLNKPVHFGVYFTVSNLWSVCTFVVFGWIFTLLASFELGRKLLLRYPEVFTAGGFSRKGPSDEEIHSASFTMTFVGRGYKDATTLPPGKKQDREIVTRIAGPEIGYVTTPITLVQAALLVLSERDRLPKGGVLTPGAAFGITDYRERLQKNGISFEVVSMRDL